MHDDVLVMILAGGEGSRLRPLTAERAKPAVPFGGRYRIIDFALSNFVNSGFFKIKVLTQYKSESLSQHISRGWHLPSQVDQYIEIVPAQQRTGPGWYIGSADAIYQNLNLIADETPQDVCVFGADNIYKMDVSQMLRFHRKRNAGLTVAAIPVPIAEAHNFGVIEVDENWKLVRFLEKPAKPPHMPGNPALALASMGNYIFDADVLVDELLKDANDPTSVHDFGKNIITNMVAKGDHPVYVYDFSRNFIEGQTDAEKGYWRDVGTIYSYWESSMELVSLTPAFNLYNRKWPIRSYYEHYPPAKFVHDDPRNARVGTAVNSIVAEGVIVSGGMIRSSVLFPRVRINSYSHVEECVLFEGVNVGRRARVRRAIVDKNVEIPPDSVIGYDLEADAKRFTVSDGIVVIPKGTVF
jgi:glucose-1-phosphate adenylyltransferase